MIQNLSKWLFFWIEDLLLIVPKSCKYDIYIRICRLMNEKDNPEFRHRLYKCEMLIHSYVCVIVRVFTY